MKQEHVVNQRERLERPGKPRFKWYAFERSWEMGQGGEEELIEIKIVNFASRIGAHLERVEHY